MNAPCTLLGFDFGLKRVGVAVGNSITAGARPLTTIEAADNATRFSAIERLIAEWTPALLVVGLPLNTQGTETDLTRRAKRFGNQLHGRFHLPVEFVDERYTSVIAESSIKAGRQGKAAVDAAAAALILQAWLDQRE